MADKNKAKTFRAERRRRRVRAKLFGTAERPRLSVTRSSKNVFAQIIDDSAQTTLIGLGTMSKAMASVVESSDNKTAAAHKVGKLIAEMAKEKGVENVIFDRNRFLYHGRVKALAEGAREGGLKF